MDAIEILSPYTNHSGANAKKGVVTQIVLSLALGFGAFFAFCILRPRWSGLYAARRKQKTEASVLPELPKTFFGWIVPLWRVTDQQILASAGLDAYVFLKFFRMASAYLAIVLFFALTVIKPVHDANPDPETDDDKKHRHNDSSSTYVRTRLSTIGMVQPTDYEWETDYLWMYLAFAYFFSILAMYTIVSNTRQVIEIRQEYLGSQTTITDRTIRLSGIPKELQSEEKIKEFMEVLDIGKVESVMLCRGWKELDNKMVERDGILRKFEEAMTVHLGHRTVERNLESLPIAQPAPPGPAATVDARDNEDNDNDQNDGLAGGYGAHVTPYERVRPMATIRYGRFNLRSKQVDAIDYYEEKLRVIDDDIRELREKEYETTPMAFVTMDSVAACQMAVQAVLDPSPLQLLANLSPAPTDVVWSNTYMPRRTRMIRAWSITALIVLLTVFWSILLVPIATALNTTAIREFLPAVGDWLKAHRNIESLVSNQLPTIILSLLVVLVPYLYDWLSNCQGMTSQGDVELSLISKNFFFTFFNFFVVFTVLGTASNAYDLFKDVGDSLKDTTRIALLLADSLTRLRIFYANYIILQGLGLFPFRLLQIGSVAMYPITRIGAKTPRDYAELVQPPVFSYGFFLPQTLVILIICMVYSVLRESWAVVLPGLAYFLIGGFVHKYQLLYCMDHRQHSTGRSWIMMCDRMLVGLVTFQLTVAGQLGTKGAFLRAALIAPLLVATVWFSYTYNRTYRPLMKYIALKSVRRAEQADLGGYTDDDVPEDLARWRNDSETRPDHTVEEVREGGLRFINPTLIVPLEKPWIAGYKASSANGSAPYRDDDEIA